MKAQSAYYSLPHNGIYRGYDSLEVHTVLATDSFCESLPQNEEIPDDAIVFWSIYGHIPNEGLECCGDFVSFESACSTAEKLGGMKKTP